MYLVMHIITSDVDETTPTMDNSVINEQVITDLFLLLINSPTAKTTVIIQVNILIIKL